MQDHGRRAVHPASSSRPSPSLLAWFLTRTTFGKSVKASAENPRPGPPRRHQPEAGLDVRVGRRRCARHALALPHGRPGAARPATSPLLGPSTLVRALAAAVIAGMVSFRRAVLRRHRDRRRPGLRRLQLPRPGRASSTSSSCSPCSSPSTSRAAQTRRRDADVLVRAEATADPRAATRPSGGSATSTAPRSSCWASSPSSLPLVVTQPSRHLLYTTILVFALHAACRSPCSPAGPASCRSARWRSPASARCSRPASAAASTSTSAGATPGCIDVGHPGR